MIVTSIIPWCPACQRTNLVNNGHTTCGCQRCLCHDCHKSRVLIPRRDKSIQVFLERALRQRLSLRAMAGIFGVSLQTVLLVAFVIGDRSEASCRRRFQRIAADYRHCTTYRDFWAA